MSSSKIQLLNNLPHRLVISLYLTIQLITLSTIFAQHPTFRGVPGRELLRNEELSIVPSIELRKRLTKRLSGIVFQDMIFIGNQLKDVSGQGALYAYGGCLVLHGRSEEIARVQAAYESEGFRMKASFGIPLDYNDRWRWR